jgi:hypothetical protein
MPTILIDLDHTLLNNTAFKTALAESLDLSPRDWSLAYEQFVRDNGTFEPKAFLAGVPTEQQQAFTHTVSAARQYLYPDALPFLAAAHEKQYRLVLVTFGNVAWQQQKLAALRLPAYVQPVPTDTTKIAVLADYIEPDTLLIDDNAAEVDAIVQQWPHVKAYWMTRPEGKYRATPPTQPHQQVNSLHEIIL